MIRTLEQKALEQRARELARRGRRESSGEKMPLLVSYWAGERWGFDLQVFEQLSDIPVTPSPTGVTFKGLVCCGFLYYQNQVLPAVSWADLVGLEEPERPVLGLALDFGVALKLSAPCRVEIVEAGEILPVARPFCKGRMGEIFLASLEFSA